MRQSDPGAGRRIHARLSESLVHVAQSGVVGRKATASAMEALSARIETGGTVAPERFRHYFALVRAAQQGRPAKAVASARKLLAAGALTDGAITVRPMADAVMSRSEQRHVRLDFGSDSLATTQIVRIPDGDVPAVIARIEGALALCQQYAPDSHALLAAVTREIIPVMGRARDGMSFDGCSSVERWGAILINMRKQRSDLGLAETLVHESSHSYLFDLTSLERLTMNTMDERYKSPLRLDPRPIDGIFHAVFVLAHMYAFLREVAENPAAPEDLQQEAEEVSARRVVAFNDGYSVLERHAKPTATGRAILKRIRAMVPPA